MTIALTKPMTREAFLAWEERQDLRYEFDGIRPVAMTGGTRAHAGIQRNLMLAIGGRLRGQRCRIFGSDLKIDTGHGFRYPDAFVTCTPGAGSSTIVADPVVIFEVLSPSTASVDQITKNREYAAIPSVRRYVLLAQDRVGATVFERAGDDWIGHVIADEATLDLPEIGIALPLAELYEGVAAEDEEA
jgi:Uma2 family endonuclease